MDTNPSTAHHADDTSPNAARIAALSYLIVMIIHRLDDHQHSFTNALIKSVKADLAAVTEHAPVDPFIGEIFKTPWKFSRKRKARAKQ